MCGIAGLIDNILSEDANRDITHKMLQKILHRGPEATQVYVEGAVSLGHNRLKIIDLSDSANQPFVWQDVVIIFNGEIYNYVEIKATLEKLGYQFRTHSDTEVICAAYKHWGIDCVTQFMGMWAFALWDKTKKTLFCSRDRFGIKPFYFINRGQNLYFASEYKALKELPFFNKDLNAEQFNRGLEMGWAIYKDETYYKDLKSLLPAHNLIWQDGKITIKRYWDIDFTQPLSSSTWSEKKEQFFSLFKESVKMHSRSDVQNGTCLSGGLDSSAISSMYSTLFPDSSIKSFSIFYENDVDERPFVYEVVKKYPRINPYYFSPTDQQIADSFHRVAYHADVPLSGSSFISQYFLMQLAKSQGVTVAIDGQGSDEYLGGYLHSFYRIIGQDFSSLHLMKGFNILNTLKSRENFNTKKTLDYFGKSMISAVSNEEKIYNLEYSRLDKLGPLKKERLQFEDKTDDKLNNFLYHLLLNTTLPTLLHFEDRNSMAFSIESRVPFLDHRLVEFAFTLSRTDRINDQAETKYILREALKEILPQAVYARKDKKGFVTPGEVKWLNGPLKFLLEIDYTNFDWLDKQKIKTIVEDYKRGDTSNARLVWKLACMDYWFKNFN